MFDRGHLLKHIWINSHQEYRVFETKTSKTFLLGETFLGFLYIDQQFKSFLVFGGQDGEILEKMIR